MLTNPAERPSNASYRLVGQGREQVLTAETNDGTIADRARFTRDEVSADFFKTFGTPLPRARFFSAADAIGAPPVALINEAMARRFWPKDDPVGRRFMSSLLFGVTATDPWTFITVSLLLTAVAALVSYFPARRAMRVDPIVALRVR